MGKSGFRALVVNGDGGIVRRSLDHGAQNGSDVASS
jgi:hypothetical protein